MAWAAAHIAEGQGIRAEIRIPDGVALDDLRCSQSPVNHCSLESFRDPVGVAMAFSLIVGKTVASVDR